MGSCDLPERTLRQEPSGSGVREASFLTGTGGDEAPGRKVVTEQGEQGRDTSSLSPPWLLDLQPGLLLATSDGS